MTVIVTGDKELDRFFRTLPDKLQRGAIRKGVRASVTAFTKQMRVHLDQMTTRRTGNLRKSLGFIRFDNVPSQGLIRAAAGTRQKKHRGHHGHLIEFGHDIVTRDGRTVGRTRPRPFMRTAQRTARAQVLMAQRQKLTAELRKLRAK